MATFGPHKNFTLAELVASDTAKARKIDNTPSEEVVEHLDELCRVFLQPLRDAWGSGIRISSGYRCPKLNNAVNGSSTSVHKLGYAADMNPSNGHIDDFIRFVVAWVASTGVKFDQLILEKNSKGGRWVHIGLYNNAHGQRCQIKQMYVK